MNTPNPEDGEVKAEWHAFRAKVKAPAVAKTKARTPAGRAEYESHGGLPDGRSKRATGRTLKITLKVRPEFKAKLAALAATRDTGMAEVLEAAIEALEGKGA